MYKTFAFDDNANEYDRWYDGNKEIYQSELLALKQVVPIVFILKYLNKETYLP